MLNVVIKHLLICLLAIHMWIVCVLAELQGILEHLSLSTSPLSDIYLLQILSVCSLFVLVCNPVLVVIQFFVLFCAEDLS